MDDRCRICDGLVDDYGRCATLKDILKRHEIDEDEEAEYLIRRYDEERDTKLEQEAVRKQSE